MKTLIPVLALFFFCTACQKKEVLSERQCLTLNVRFDPQTLDPRKARVLNDIILLKSLFEGLTRIGSAGRPALALANDMTLSEDGTVYTFSLRPTYWSNGDKVSAHDFVYAWKSTLDPNFPSDNAALLYYIKNARAVRLGKQHQDTLGVKALDDNTLVVELEQPTPYFLQLLSNPIYFPIHAKCDQNNPNWPHQVQNYISNGPFKLATWKYRDIVSFKSNPHYWDREGVKLTQIDMIMVSEETGLRLFRTGKLDWVGLPLSTIPFDSMQNLQDQNLLQSGPFMGINMIRINTQKKPFTKKEVRQAFSAAIDRAAIVDHVLLGGGYPSTTLVPKTLGLNNHLKTEAIEDYRKMIQHLKLQPVTLMYPASDGNHKIAQAIQHQWKSALGIEVTLEGLERKIYFDRLSKQNYELALSSWIADFADPINFLNVFKTKTNGTNNTHWENLDYTAYLNESALVQDPQARIEVLAKAEALILDEMPMIPTFAYSMRYVINPKLKNVILTPMGSVDFKNAYFLD